MSFLWRFAARAPSTICPWLLQSETLGATMHPCHWTMIVSSIPGNLTPPSWGLERREFLKVSHVFFPTLHRVKKDICVTEIGPARLWNSFPSKHGSSKLSGSVFEAPQGQSRRAPCFSITISSGFFTTASKTIRCHSNRQKLPPILRALIWGPMPKVRQ